MKKTIIIISSLIVVAILGFVVYSLLFSSKVPQKFIDKYNEAVALGKEAQQLSDLTSMPEMDALDKQMESEDYIGALKSLEAALGRKKNASSKLSSIDSKLVELSAPSFKISDAKIKAGTDKFIDISKKENSAKIKYNDLQIQILEKTKTMVEILVKSKTISLADEKSINDLSKEIGNIKNQIDNAEKEVNNVQSQYKAIEKEFFGLAGLEITN